jgi:hypothetical protein
MHACFLWCHKREVLRCQTRAPAASTEDRSCHLQRDIARRVVRDLQAKKDEQKAHQHRRAMQSLAAEASLRPLMTTGMGR